MKLDRLSSTTRNPIRDAAERARALEADALRRVGPAEPVDADRERSLQQELEAAKSHLPDSGSADPTLAEARALAERLVHLGAEAETFVEARPHRPFGRYRSVR
ncbi:MAG: hypothetical protein IPJ99_01020 [Betaproteobacteria bacterium]|nr:hypothetical protein [Betaproteobacteria bacterium]